MSSIGLDFPQRSSVTGIRGSHQSLSKTCVDTWELPKTSPRLITQEWMDNQSVQTNGLSNISTFGPMLNRRTGPLIFLWQNSHITHGTVKPCRHLPSVPLWGITHGQHGKY